MLVQHRAREGEPATDIFEGVVPQERHPANAALDLELLAPVELSAVCFRYRGRMGDSGGDLSQLNAAILKRLVDRGRVYLSNATLRGKFCLRACLVNHRTTEADVDQVVPEVLAAAP